MAMCAVQHVAFCDYHAKLVGISLGLLRTRIPFFTDFLVVL